MGIAWMEVTTREELGRLVFSEWTSQKHSGLLVGTEQCDRLNREIDEAKPNAANGAVDIEDARYTSYSRTFSVCVSRFSR